MVDGSHAEAFYARCSRAAANLQSILPQMSAEELERLARLQQGCQGREERAMLG
jgi:hypothetical protein